LRLVQDNVAELTVRAFNNVDFSGSFVERDHQVVRVAGVERSRDVRAPRYPLPPCSHAREGEPLTSGFDPGGGAGREVRITIRHSADHPTVLHLPATSGDRIGTLISGGQSKRSASEARPIGERGWEAS
jgi:hypothetical protein